MEKSNNKLFTFLRRNAVYIVLAFCILAIGLSITLILVNKENKVLENTGNTVIEVPVDEPKVEPTVTPTEEPEKPVEPVVNVRTFVLPIADYDSLSEYTTAMVYNSTMKRFTAHNAVDFFAEEGTPVYAVSDGTVESVETTLIYGTTVVINHGDGIKSVYNSLADGDNVTVGQKVNKGDVIGEVSLSNRQEYKEGAHLHFQMTENGVVIDPETYLTFERK